MTLSVSKVQAISVMDLFTIGIGPSSSHTVGPMRAARDFAERASIRSDIERVVCELFGSLALTGLGHATDTAILLGLSGWQPETIDPDQIEILTGEIREGGRLKLSGRIELPFREAEHLLFRRGEFLPGHANAMRFSAYHRDTTSFEATYFSIGGGAILRAGEAVPPSNVDLPHPFSSAAELLVIGAENALTIAAISPRAAPWPSREIRSL